MAQTKLTTRRIAFAGVLAAAYAAVTLLEGMLVPTLAYGTIQYRFAEAFSVLCCFTPAAIPGMVIGCMAANLASFVSAWDFLIGSSATLLACLLTWALFRDLDQKRWKLWLVPLPTILCNAVIVGAEIAFFFDTDRAFLTAYGVNALFVGIGEAAVMYLLGLPLLLWMRKSETVRAQFRTL